MNVLRSTAHLVAVAAALLIVSACSQDNVRRAANTDARPVLADDTIEQMFTDALTHLQQEEYHQGIELLETLTAKENRLAAPFVNLGIAYSRTGNTKKAEYSFSRALRLDAGHAVANNELGLLYRKTGRFNAAKSAYMNALVDHPDYLPVRKNLGILCELYLHDMECALEQYQAYLEYAPEEETVARWALELKQRTQ
jgi:tetratricopeptide (TPR) repeat protein